MSLRRYRSLLFKHSMIRISINCNTCYCCLSIKNPTPCLCHASVPFRWDLRPLYAYIPYKLFNMLHFYLFTSSFAFLLKRGKKSVKALFKAAKWWEEEEKFHVSLSVSFSQSIFWHRISILLTLTYKEVSCNNMILQWHIVILYCY